MNATDICQSCDIFVIQKPKEVWIGKCDEYKCNCVLNFEMETTKSGKIPNPGKRFFLQLSADTVREVNCRTHKSSLSLAFRLKIFTGMSLNVNGKWEESQVIEQLQLIIAKFRSHFEGLAVDPDDGEEEDTEEDN